MNLHDNYACSAACATGHRHLRCTLLSHQPQADTQHRLDLCGAVPVHSSVSQGGGGGLGGMLAAGLRQPCHTLLCRSCCTVARHLHRLFCAVLRPLSQNCWSYVCLDSKYGLQATQLQISNAGIADKVKFGELKFKRYPENLLNSRARYGRAFQV